MTKHRSIGRRVVAALGAFGMVGLTTVLGITASAPPAAAANAPVVDLWSPGTITLTQEDGPQTARTNHIYAYAVIRHDPGTSVNGVRFDLVHASSGGTYNGTNCATTQTITCSGGYLASGGWTFGGGQALTWTSRELPGQASTTTNTDSNYTGIWIDIKPRDGNSWQNDGPDGGNVCGLESGGPRLCLDTASFSFRTSDGQTTADQTMQYFTVGENDGSGEDFPAVFATTSTDQATVTAGAANAVTLGWTCDDNDGGGGNDCDSAFVRFRRAGDNKSVVPGATSDTEGISTTTTGARGALLVCSDATGSGGCEGHTGNNNHVVGNFNADDNTARSYTYRAPRTRGLYYIEALFCDDDGFCPHGTVPSYSPAFNETTTMYGNPGTEWQLLGSFYVNDAAPTVSFGSTTQTGGGSVGTHPTTGALHPNTGTTITYNVTPSADTQVVDWNLDQNNTNGINGSGYESRQYGTMSYASSAGTPTLGAAAKQQSRDLSGYGSGVNCAAAVRVYDTGAVNAVDQTVQSATASKSCTTNNIPAATAVTGLSVQRGTTSASFNLPVSDADRWSAGSNGGDEAPTVTLTQPSNGTVSCGAFVPATTTTGNFPCTITVPRNTTPGAFSGSFTVTDSHAGTSTSAAISGTIVNTTPTATGQTRSIQRGTSLTFNLNGSDPINNDTIDGTLTGTGYATVSTAAMPAGSSTSCTAAGSCTVAIAANTAVGNYSFTWNVKDNANTSTTATETVQVTNTAPASQSFTQNNVQRGRPASEASFNLSSSDANGDTLTYSVVSTVGLPASSTLTCSSAGACTLTVPSNTAIGNYSFTYKSNDGQLDSNTATVTVGVANTTPVANNVGPLHTTVGATLPVILNGTDFNSDTLTYNAPVSSPTKGNLSGSGLSRNYVASNGTKGNDSFTYTVSDNAPSTSTAGTVSIVIDNTAPTANGQTTSAPRQIATPITLSGADVNADAITFAVQSTTTKGSLSCDTAGSCTYTAAVGKTGDDSFTFVTNDGTTNSAPATVTIHITNTAPTANAQTTSAPRQIPTGITLTGSDPNNDPLTFTGPVSGPSKGSVTCDATGNCSYTAGAGQTGDDSFTFSVSDGFGGSDTATVTIHITNSTPTATGDTVDAPRRVATPITLSGTDPNNDPLTFTAPISGPSKGTLTCTGADCSYTSDAGQTGSDSFTFTVSDAFGGTSSEATIDINLTNSAPDAQEQSVNAVRTAPTSITLGATDPNLDTLTYSVIADPTKGLVSCSAAGACTYTSAGGQSGTDSFTFSVSDGQGGSDSAVVTITLVNTAPIAEDQSISVPRRVPTPITLSASDANNDTLTYSAPASGPSKGSLDCTGPACTYTSDAGATGTDSFTFSVDDGFGGSDTATVDITLTNSDPVADAQALSAPVHVATPITLTGSDDNQDSLSFSVTGDPTKGQVSCTSGGSCSYRSDAGASGADAFTFTVNDGHGGTDSADVTISLSNDRPVADPQTVDAPRRVATGITLSGSDPNDDPLTYAIVGQPTKGVLTCVDFTCSYTSNAGQVGTDSFTFTVSDGAGGTSDPATVSINLTNLNPTANGGAYSVTKGIAKAFTLTGADANQDSLTFSIVNAPTNGTLTCSGTGNANCVYTATSTTGSDSLTFIATDPFAGSSAPATINFGIGLPKASIGEAQILEPDDANQGVFVPLTLSAPLTQDVIVSYYTQDGTATSSGPNPDYLQWGTPAVPRTITIAAGKTWTPVSPPVKPDALTEPDETFQVKIVSARMADNTPVPLGDSTATVTIFDNHRATADPLMLVQDSWSYEGDQATGTKGQFVIQFSKHVSSTFTLNYATVPGTASQAKACGGTVDTKGPITGSITVTPTSALMLPIDVPYCGDTVTEDNETVQLQVLLPDGVQVVQKDASGAVWVLNDD